MSKKLMIAVLSVVLLIGGASTALAATDEGTLNEIKWTDKGTVLLSR